MYGLSFRICCDCTSQGKSQYLETTLCHLRLIIPNHLLDTHPNSPFRLPLQTLLCPGGIRSPPLRIICGQWVLVHDLYPWLPGGLSVLFGDLFDYITNQGSKVVDRELIGVPEVTRASFVRVHESDEAVNKIVDILE